MKLRYILGLILLTLIVSPAHARRHHVSYVTADPGCNIIMPCEGVVRSQQGERAVKAMGGLGVAVPRYERHSQVNYRKRPYAAPVGRQMASYEGAQIVGHPSGCPRTAFCGCGAAVRVFGHPVRDLWLASNWFRFPRTAAAPGMAAVRNHHVFIIETVLGNGMVMAYDANSGGHATRIHARSLAGYTIVNPRT